MYRKLSRIFSFIISDHDSEEFRLTDRFCIENAFKRIEPKKSSRNKIEPQLSFDQYLFCHTNSLHVILIK